MPGSWPPAALPNLNDQNCIERSRATTKYNCFAWAAWEDTRWWEPDPFNINYWPPSAPRELTMGAVIAAYSTRGYLPCGDASLEPGFEKIALFAITDPWGAIIPTHAARQLPDGRWTSKLGPFEDVEHTTVDAVDCPTYGSTAQFLKKPIPVRPVR
jgi:hypothetical protein